MHRLAQLFEIFRIDRIDSCKHHRLYLFEPFDGFRTRSVHMGDSITYLYLTSIFNTRNDISYIARTNNIFRYLIQLQCTHLICYIFFSCSDKVNFVALTDFTVFYLKLRHDTSERVVYRVKNQGLQRSLWITLWCGDTLYDGTQNFRNSHSCLS